MTKDRDEQKGAPKRDAQEDRRHYDDQQDDRDRRGAGHLDPEDGRREDRNPREDHDEAERPHRTEPRR
jgi:hypothetical protein